MKPPIKVDGYFTDSIIVCPFCKLIHTHGNCPGSKVPHCDIRPDREYFIVMQPGPMPAKMKKSAEQRRYRQNRKTILAIRARRALRAVYDASMNAINRVIGRDRGDTRDTRHTAPAPETPTLPVDKDTRPHKWQGGVR